MLDGGPRHWGLLQSKRSPPPPSGVRQLAVPEGLGARLAAAELCGEAGEAARAPELRRAELLELPCFAEALRALLAAGVDAVLWELTPQERARLCEVRGVELACDLALPWPSHLFIAARETLQTKLGTIRHFLRFSNALSKHIKSANAGAALEYFKKNYDLSADQAARWFRGSPWEFSFDIDASAIMGPLVRLRKLQLVPNAHETVMAHRLAPGVSVFTASSTAHMQDGRTTDGRCDEDTAGFDEGSVLPISEARSHNFLPELSEPLLCPELPWRCRRNDQRLLQALAPPEAEDLPPEALSEDDSTRSRAGQCLHQDRKEHFDPVPAG